MESSGCKVLPIGGMHFFAGQTIDGFIVAVPFSEILEVNVTENEIFTKNGGSVKFAESLSSFFWGSVPESQGMPLGSSRWPKDMLLSDLPLPTRAQNRFREFGIKTVSDLETLSEAEILRLPNLGMKTMRQVVDLVFKPKTSEFLAACSKPSMDVSAKLADLDRRPAKL